MSAILGEDEDALRHARDEVGEQLGPEAFVDAAAVAAMFNTINRVADATGIPLDGMLDLASAPLRERMGIDRFLSAGNTPAPGRLKRALSRVMEPMVPRAMRLMASLQGKTGKKNSSG